MSGRTSGSISLDMGDVAEAVTDTLRPMLGQVNTNLERLAGLLASTALDEDAAVDVLTKHLPTDFQMDGYVMDARDVAGHLTEHLAQAGYALVAVAGPALEAEVARNGFRGVAPAPVVDPALAQAKREDEWFSDGRTDD